MANQPSIKILKESAKRFGCDNLAGGSIKSACDSLYEFFVESFGEEELAKCPICKYDSPEKDQNGNLLANCPYCASKFLDTPAVETKPEKTTKVAKKRSAEKEPEPEYIATPEQKEELQEHLDRINELRSNVAQNTFDLGVELNTINDKGLWRGLGYDSFFAYTQAELDFSRASAYKYMLVAREFDKETFLVVGVKKGELIAAAPDRHKNKLLKSAKEGKSFTELRAKLDKLEGKSRGSGAGSKGPSERVTLLGHVKKGENVEIQWLSSQTHKPIVRKDVKSKYAIIALTDEVELVIIPSDNELGLVATFRKIGEASTAPTPETETITEAAPETKAPKPKKPVPKPEPEEPEDEEDEELEDEDEELEE